MKITAIVLATSALAAGTRSFTQNARQPQNAGQAEQSEGAGRGVGDIVVTANRIETSAQNTPIALNGYNDLVLANSGINSVGELSEIYPSLDASSANSSPYITARSIASSDITALCDPSVPCLTTHSPPTEPPPRFSNMMATAARSACCRLPSRTSTVQRQLPVPAAPRLRRAGERELLI